MSDEFTLDEQQLIDDADNASREDAQVSYDNTPDPQVPDNSEYSGGEVEARSLWESVKEAFTLTGSPNSEAYGFGASTGYTGTNTGFGGTGTDPAVGNPPAGSLWNTVKGFWTDAMNEKGSKTKLIELGFGAIAGMAKDSAAKDAAKYKAEADMAILNQKDKLEQEANQRFSQSVGSLKPVQPYKPKPLTRMDGSRVFTPTGLINTGVK